ncbi:MAG: pyridine nucleotide-disulfide oxidoreductase/dicluster-binding protein [Chloroflexota bacterium]
MDQKQMRELENRCIQEHAPACTAACPIHVDARSMLAEAARGDFAAGLKALRKALPFPGIISHICDQPCRTPCKRAEAGDPIQVAAIERACLAWGGPLEPVTRLPRKPRRVAVVGGGLSGLTAAYDLARKGYEVVIYEATGRLGGQAWDDVPERLPEVVLLADLAVLAQLGVEVLTNTPVGRAAKNGHQPPLSLLCDEYEAIYLGVGPAGSETYDLALDGEGRIQVDPQTLQTSRGGVFAGGGLLLARAGGSLLSALQAEGQVVTAEQLQAPAPARRSPIRSVLDGRRAATSIDRYLQRVSLTAARANEGPYTTRLYTSTQGLAVAPEMRPAGPGSGYSQAEAQREAGRCIQCECMECVKKCAYLEHYGGYPKKYIREVYNNLSIVMGTRFSNKLINSCSLCGLCGEVCPEALDMGAICKDARQEMVKQKRMPPSAHDFALRDLAFSSSAHFALARNQPGTTTSAYLFFPGCQLSASRPEYIEPLYNHLCQVYAGSLSAGSGVGLALRCCGAPADWAGRQDLFDATRQEFLAEHERLGRPALVLACSSCYQVFKTHYPQVEVRSLWEVLDEHGLPVSAAPAAAVRRLAIHDPCSTRHESGLQDSVRRLLQRAGVEVEELPLNRRETECCSYGGAMWLAHPELAEKVVQRRIQASPTDYVTYCAMCRDFFAREGKPVLHVLDLLLAADPAALAHRKGPGFSERHANRARLKRRLLQNLWSEAMDDSMPAAHIRLEISPELRETLEKRLVLEEDIRQVIDLAEQTGARLLNKKTGHSLASHKLGSVTYWVEYSPEGQAFRVHNAYSHRMEIGEEGKK